MALKKLLTFLGIISLLFIAFVVGFYLQNFGYLGISTKQEVWAQFGDFVGGTLNPILAFFAFIALLYTIKLQSDSLETSKNELQATREELSKSAKAQEEQSKSLKLQNQSTNLQVFENTFFQLLNQHNEYLDLMIKDTKIIYYDYGNARLISLSTPKVPIKREIMEKNFKELNHEKRSIKNYFMTLYQILKFIEEKSKKYNIDGKFYTNIIRALIDDEVLRTLALNCITFPQFTDYKKYIEKYEFFEHIYIEEKNNETATILEILTFFDKKAFGKNAALIELIKK